MSLNLEHINILFHAFSDGSSGLLCPFIYLCFCPRHRLIQNRQFYFDSYLYVKCERGARLVIAPVLCCLLKQPFFVLVVPETSCQWISCSSSQYILSKVKLRNWKKRQGGIFWQLTDFETIHFLSFVMSFLFIRLFLFMNVLVSTYKLNICFFLLYVIRLYS